MYPVDGIVRALIEALFAIFDEFDRIIRLFKSRQLTHRHGNTRRNIVFHRNFSRRTEVFAQGEYIPRMIGTDTYLQIINHYFLVEIFKLMSCHPIHEVNGEMRFPIVAPNFHDSGVLLKK